ncbi:unnamed protein product [Brachionus calyciflorus]|uniref:Integrase catalytic domain-containing protein n=1 Tax=Brachionus calyciflorus TaxID=104777 RepID=A0A814LID3_9BILA|nr:unnamed protein product [Brachionus calyciflorus]
MLEVCLILVDLNSKWFIDRNGCSVSDNSVRYTEGWIEELMMAIVWILDKDKIGMLKNHEIKLHIDGSIRPVQQKLRPVPFHLRPLVEAELMKMDENDVIEPVNGPTPWVSAVVPVPKPDRPNEVRICTDAREMNKAILRTRQSFPTVEDLAVKLNGVKQNFGINEASEIFQKTIEQILSGLDGCVYISDDIIVYGSDKAEHDLRLEAVLKRLNESGLTVNESKCELDLKKCDALLNAKAPKSVGEVRSLLGLSNYCSRFIPDYATVVEPLRQLTKKSLKWSLEEQHDQALNRMKKLLSTKALNYFDPKLRTEVTVDASPVGVAAVLAQYDPKKPNEKHVIMYASHSLTKVEQRYSQIEREALAVVWACEKFHLYIYAKEFDIITDNKAVELISGNVRSKPKARIERWCLRLLPYKFVIKHKSGAFNIADYMSRNPTEPADNSTENSLKVNMVSTFGIPKAISRSDLNYGTKEDEQLIEVAKMVQALKYVKIDSFERIKTELTLTNDGLILRGNRVVIPNCLQKQVIKITHGGHMGIIKTKQLIRGHVWFPNIDKQVEEMVKKCHKCQINSDLTKFEPICPSEMPDAPWVLASIDFYGPLKCGKYLLALVCEYSRFPIVKVISRTTCDVVISALNEIFSIFGLPEAVKSDNGPPFNSYKFKQFSLEQGFIHKKITPLWPISNDWEGELTEFLRNYRDTPHSSTGETPNKLMFQYNAKTSKLPMELSKFKVENQVHEQAKLNDAKAKAKMKTFNDRNLWAQVSHFKVGDKVLLKWKRSSKSDTYFDPDPFKIIEINGSMITVEKNGKILVRNSSFMKLYIQPTSEF